MRLLVAVPLLLITACSVAPRIVGTADDRIVDIRNVSYDLAQADFVALGELHGIQSVHRTHLALIEALHVRRPNMVIAMEMFERDVQLDLLQYLAGAIDEATFLAKSRPWPKYVRDYRPVVEFAKHNGIIVLAANAPRPLARKVSKEGVESVAGEKHVARETTAPVDDYYDAFVTMMGDHAGMLGEGAMERFYAAQCLKDDTMAESICDHLAKHTGDNAPLAILICGKMHSDYRRGTVQRVIQRMPSLKVRVLSVEQVEELASNTYSSPSDIADYVIVTQETLPEPKLPQGTAMASQDRESDRPEEDVSEHEGLRPALGFMPGYASTESGVMVASVREGGPAARGGLREGDRIVELAGEPVEDIQDYSDVLNELKIGRTVAVRVVRGEQQLDLEIVVTSRSR